MADTALDTASDTPVRERILKAAEKCFAQYGVVPTTVDDVVRVSGVPRATLYRHVGNKEQLIVALALRHMERTLERTLAITRSHDDLDDALVHGLSFAVDNAREYELVAAQLAPAGMSERLVSLIEPTRKVVANRLIEFFEVVLEPFRASGQVRPDLSNADAASWLSVVISGFVWTPESVGKQQRERLLRAMLLPAFRA